eukprot:3510852-Rhodomonas_salina.1
MRRQRRGVLVLEGGGRKQNRQENHEGGLEGGAKRRAEERKHAVRGGEELRGLLSCTPKPTP